METNSCPKCGSSNIQFKRERSSAKCSSSGAGVKLSKNISVGGGGRNTTYDYRNIGFCKDCGHSWEVGMNGGVKHSIWWWILAIIFFPISLSIWFWKTDKFNLSNKVKGIILGVIWVILIICYIITPKDEKESKSVPTVVESTTESTTESYSTEQTKETTEDNQNVNNNNTNVEEKQSPDSNNAPASNTDSNVAPAQDTNNEAPAQDTNNQPQDSNANIVDTPVNNTENISNDTRGSFVVNKENGTLHRSTCSYGPDPENSIYFDSAEAANANGYTKLCGHCFK